MGKKYKKKVQWKQLSLTDIVSTNAEERQIGDDCEEEEGDSAPQTPTHEDPPYPRQPYKPNFNNPRRGFHNHHGYYHANYDRRFDKNFDRYSSENFRNLENRGPGGPFEKPYSNKPFYDRNYHYDKFYARHPFYGEHNFKFANGAGGFMERGRRPFRPYGRPGFFSPRGFPGHFGGGPFRDPGKGSNGCEGEDEEEEWDEEGFLVNEGHHHHQQNGEGDGGGGGVNGGVGGGDGGGGNLERPSQPVHTVMINNEYTKIQTPRQEVIFKKSSLDRKRDSIDQGSVTGSVSSGSGSSSTTGGEPGSGSAGNGDQVPCDGSSVAGSVEDTSLSMTGEDPPDIQQQDQVFEDPIEIFAGEPGGPPLAGVVMQQAYPGGPMITIPVHWTPFIDPTLIPGETALTPLDPAFTHVIDPKSLPIDPLHILPVQHDATGCPVHVQVKVDSNGVPIQIQPTAFTVSLSSLHQQHHDQQGVLNPQDQLHPQDHPHPPHDQQNVSLQHQMSTEEEEEEEETEKCEPAEEEILEDEENLTPDDETEGSCHSSRKNSEGNEDMVLDSCASDEIGVSAEVDTTVEKSLGEKEEEVKDSLKENDGENEGIMEEESEIEETDDNKMERHCPKRDKTENKELASDETSYKESTTSAAVPSTNAEVISSTESLAPSERERARGGRKHHTQPEEAEAEAEEEDEEEEEEMLAKETEEGSDSSDSQYASMSESSTTPTTPACEPFDSHEAPESHRVEASQENQQHTPETCSAHPQGASDQDVLTSGTPTEELTPCDAKDEASYTASENNPETSETNGTSTSDQDHPQTISDFTADHNPTQETTENVLQGYVMVPILTPYYDPSVFYGYPVVVGEQTPQQQHQRGYSKRKKKKYQRRRHADVPAAGGYLDPQLYTGEPFVATPSGYVVPVEAASSVCQVHGFQYVTSPFPLHQHLDEGFVQHPSYALNVLDAAAQQALHLAGTNQEDSKTIFSDLQETERRQIQEILQEQRAKVEKSDSTESSDSGVSESEEVVTAELSSDEQDTQKNNLENSVSSGIPENSTKDSIISTQSHEESSELSETEESKLSQGSIVDSNACLDTHVQDVEEKQPNAQSKLPGNDLSANHSPTTPALPIVDDQSDQAADTTDASIYHDDDAALKLQIGNSALADKRGINADEDLINDKSANKDIEIQSILRHSREFSKPDSTETIFTAKELSSTPEESENSGDSKCNAQFKEKGLDDSVIVTSENKPSIENSAPNSEVKSTASGIHNCSDPISSQTEQVQAYSTSSEKHISDTDVSQRVICSFNKGKSVESVDHDSLQDLRVTEAVKRWIREVTPEKAFSLSEEVQTRLLEQSIEEEMDTEDEYIEDEIPQTAQSTLQNPKNVKGNPFAAVSSDAPLVGMENCSKRVAVSNRQRGMTPDTLDDYDGSSTISNLSFDHLYSEASSSQPASFNQSFEEDDIDKHTENPNIYNPVVYAKYYQLGVEVDDSTPAATPLPHGCQMSRETTPVVQAESETVSECGSEDIETIPHKYDVVCQYTATSPMSLATEILKAEKVLSNMSHITGTQLEAEASGSSLGNPDIYLKHYETARRMEVGDSGVQSEESSDEMEARSNVGSSGVGSSLASTPAVSPAHRFQGRPPLQPHPLRNLSAGEGPVPCRTVCCAVM